MARLVPLTVDGLIYASSMVMFDSARRKTPVPVPARWLLGLGDAATLAGRRFPSFRSRRLPHGRRAVARAVRPRGVAAISWHRDGSRIKNSLAASARLASIEANAARDSSTVGWPRRSPGGAGCLSKVPS